MPRAAMGVSGSTLSALASAMASFGSELSAGVILFVTSAALSRGAQPFLAPVLSAGQLAKARKYNRTRFTIGTRIRSPIQPGYPVRWQIRQTGMTIMMAITSIHSQCPAHMVFANISFSIMASEARL